MEEEGEEQTRYHGTFSPDQRRALGEALMDRRALLHCPRCGMSPMSLEPHYGFIPLGSDPAVVKYGGGQTLACAILLCPQCGYVVLHHIAQLRGSPLPVDAGDPPGPS